MPKFKQLPHNLTHQAIDPHTSYTDGSGYVNVQLSEDLAEGTQTPRSQESVLMSEIAERLIEWSECRSRKRAHHWLSRIATLANDEDSVDALWIYLRLATGDLSQLTASYSEIGEARHRTKQAEQQEHARALRVVSRHFPELRSAIDELLMKGAGHDAK